MHQHLLHPHHLLHHLTQHYLHLLLNIGKYHIVFYLHLLLNIGKYHIMLYLHLLLNIGKYHIMLYMHLLLLIGKYHIMFLYASSPVLSSDIIYIGFSANPKNHYLRSYILCRTMGQLLPKKRNKPNLGVTVFQTLQATRRLIHVCSNMLKVQNFYRILL